MKRTLFWIALVLALCYAQGIALAEGPALTVDPPAWAFVVPADVEPSLPVDDFLAELAAAPTVKAIERASAAEPFEVDVESAAVAAMIAEGESL